MIKDEIEVSEDSIKKMSNLAHISGNKSLINEITKDHLSGTASKIQPGHISGVNQKDQAITP